MSRMHSRVLIVDDEYYLGQMLAKALINENIQAIAVTDVDSAINWLNRQNFDLVVSDIYLPHKSGMDLFNYAKEHHLEVPFIFMTGNPDLEMAVQLLTQGGYDYIIKPFMMPDFLKKVRNVIQAHHSRKQEKKLVKNLRMLLEERLSELRIYEDVFESIGDGVLITDLEGNIVKINHGFERISRVPPLQLLHQPLRVLKDIAFNSFDSDEILHTLQKNENWSGDLVGRRQNGEIWYASVTFSPIRDENNRVFAFTGLFQDVTTQREVEQALIDSLKKMNQAQEAIIFGLASLAEHRDQATGYHLERIRSYCKVLAEALQERNIFPDIVTPTFIHTLYQTAPLHDIGKVGIPDYILLKEEKLTQPEFEIMKTHTEIGYRILNSIRQQYGEMAILTMGAEITYYHHERWDGSGYPRGLKGEAIPLSAQILAIADVYDALTTERSYKKAFSHQTAVELMKQERGKHFSPIILDVFLEIHPEFDRIRRTFRTRQKSNMSSLPGIKIGAIT